MSEVEFSMDVALFRLKLNRSEAITIFLSCASCLPSRTLLSITEQILHNEHGINLIHNCSFRHLFDKSIVVFMICFDTYFRDLFRVIVLGLFFRSCILFRNTHS